MQTSIAEQSYLIMSRWCVENLSYAKGKGKKGLSIHPCDAPEFEGQRGVCI